VLTELPELLTRHAQLAVLTAPTIDQALRKLASNAVDVVVADLKLGKPNDADGGDLLDAVARWHPGCARILFSIDPIGAEIARSGEHHWFDKDGDISELVGLIRRVARRG